MFYIDKEDKRGAALYNLLKAKGREVFNFNTEPAGGAGAVYIFSPARKFTAAEISALPKGITLFCGALSSEAEAAAAKNSVRYFNLMNDEIFVWQNSQLTAEGVLALIIENTPRSIYENKALILGCGKLGKAVALMLNKIGMKFAMANYGEARYKECFLFTEECYLGAGFESALSNFDVIINTIPAEIFNEEMIKKVQPGALFLETASKNCLDAQKAQHFIYLPAPALPTKYTHESAAKAILGSVERGLKI